MLREYFLLLLVSIVVSQGPVLDSRCPLINRRPAINLPHESDCRLFYKCHFGNRWLMPPCPRGTLFDATANACVAAAIARCTESSTIPTAPTISTTLSSTKTSELQSSDTSSDQSTIPTAPSVPKA